MQTQFVDTSTLTNQYEEEKQAREIGEMENNTKANLFLV